MGLGRLLTRSTVYTATETVTGATATYTIVDGLSPDFVSPGSYRGAMTVPGAWRASLLLSGLLGMLPWNAYRQPVGKPEERIDPTPPLLEQPAPPDTRMTTFRSLALDLIYHGNGIGLVAARNAQGWPTAMVPVPAVSVSNRRVPVDDPVSYLPPGSIEYQVGTLRLAAQDVIHIKGPCEPGALRGMGVLEAHMNTLNLANDQAKQARDVSRHGVPSGIIKSDDPDLTDVEALDMKAKWMANQASRTVQVINSSTSFTPLAWNPEQMQLIEARRFTNAELELIFGLPSGWLGGMTSARQYSNIEQDAINLLRFSLGDHLAQFEQTLSLAMPRGTVARGTVDAVLRADTLSRYQAHAIALSNRFLTVDEVRDIEHRPPLPQQPAPELAGGEQEADGQMPIPIDMAGRRRMKGGM